MNSNYDIAEVAPFSYAEYRNILQSLSEQFDIIDYGDIDEKTESFCVIRHDIEFSVERALEMAKLESEMNVKTSYFFQINNNTYNPFSSKNLAIIHDIAKLGHKIGIHFTPSSSKEKIVRSEFFMMKRIFEDLTKISVDRFSFHRPNLNSEVLSENINIDGIINVYSNLFFEYFDDKIPEDPEIKYISDSNHQWKYGHPLDSMNSSWRKIHILIHPFSWSSSGGNNYENYLNLLKEKNDTLMESINEEISNFPISDIITHYNNE